MSTESRPVVIRMPPELHAAVKAKAASEERAMAQTIRHALRIYTAPVPDDLEAAQVENARGVLGWYGDASHYVTRRGGSPPKILSDGGQRARDALDTS